MCVLQTVLDLLRDNYVVYVVLDGVGSQRAEDRDGALQRLSAYNNVLFTTSESLIYEILGNATMKLIA